MKSNAKSVEEYLNELPEDRRSAIEKVRQTILNNLPEGYEEVMNWGMITYQVPLKIFPNTYNKKPLMYAALSSQKNHMAVYLTGIYMDEKSRQNFEAEYKNTGKRMDVGKSCVRFQKIEDGAVQKDAGGRFVCIKRVSSDYSDTAAEKPALVEGPQYSGHNPRHSLYGCRPAKTRLLLEALFQRTQTPFRPFLPGPELGQGFLRFRTSRSQTVPIPVTIP